MTRLDIYMDPEAELRALDSCHCAACQADYRTVAEDALDGARGEHPRLDVALRWGRDDRTSHIARDVASIVRDAVAARWYARAASQSASSSTAAASPASSTCSRAGPASPIHTAPRTDGRRAISRARSAVQGSTTKVRAASGAGRSRSQADSITPRLPQAPTWSLARS